MNTVKKPNELKVRRGQYWTLEDVVRVYGRATIEDLKKRVTKLEKPDWGIYGK